MQRPDDQSKVEGIQVDRLARCIERLELVVVVASGTAIWPADAT